MWAEPKEINKRCVRTPAWEITGRHYPPPGVKGREQLWKLSIKATNKSLCSRREEPSYPGNLMGCLPLNSCQGFHWPNPAGSRG